MKTIGHMVEHAKKMKTKNLHMYNDLVSLWKKFARGENGGQFEPWYPTTIRDHYYSGWSDQDFTEALNNIGEA